MIKVVAAVEDENIVRLEKDVNHDVIALSGSQLGSVT